MSKPKPTRVTSVERVYTHPVYVEWVDGAMPGKQQEINEWCRTTRPDGLADGENLCACGRHVIVWRCL